MSCKAAVAVIMPVYNAQNTVLAAVKSVLRQTHGTLKLYIIDDGSMDNSVDIVRGIDDSRIVVMCNDSNHGVSFSRNRGLDESSEPLIAFIDSDDVWHADKLESQLNIMDDFDIALSSYIYIEKNKTSIIVLPRIITKTEYLKKKYRICFSTLLFKRSILNGLRFKAIGHEDFLFINRLICASADRKMTAVRQPKVDYIVQQNSLSAQKKKAAIWHWNILRHELNYPVLKCSWLYVHYVFRALLFKWTVFRNV